jgi:hypothetical protein
MWHFTPPPLSPLGQCHIINLTAGRRANPVLIAAIDRTPFSPPQHAQEPPEASHEPPARRRAATIQQTVYLPPAVHDQLRELAFAERVKMHALLMEGLDLVFRAWGLKPSSELTRMP